MADGTYINVVIGEDLQKLADHLSSLKMTNTQQAMKTSAIFVSSVWKMYASGAPIKGSSIQIKHATGTYAKSIQIRKLGRFGYEIYSTDPKAETLEYGHPSVDLKKILPFGPKSRVGKNGPYNIIPFRHGTPGRTRTPLPSSLYNKIRVQIQRGEFRRSRVLQGVTFEKNAAGELVPRRTYAWGSRLSEAEAGRADLAKMVAFEIPGGAGGQVRSSYMTFRVISAKKPKNYDKRPHTKSWEDSWVVPAKEGMHITDHVKRNTESLIKSIVADAVQKDIGV